MIVRTDRLQPRGGTRGADEFDRAFAAINWPPRADAALDPAKGESPRTYSLPVSRRTLCENSDAELARRISDLDFVVAETNRSGRCYSLDPKADTGKHLMLQ